MHVRSYTMIVVEGHTQLVLEEAHVDTEVVGRNALPCQTVRDHRRSLKAQLVLATHYPTRVCRCHGRDERVGSNVLVTDGTP